MKNQISIVENFLFLQFCAETCNDIAIVSRNASSIFFRDRADFRTETIMFGLHRTDDGRYFFIRYIHSDVTDMESIDMFLKDGKKVLFDTMEKAIAAYSMYRFDVL